MVCSVWVCCGLSATGFVGLFGVSGVDCLLFEENVVDMGGFVLLVGVVYRVCSYMFAL